MNDQQHRAVDNKRDEPEGQDIEGEGNDSDEVSDNGVDHAENCCNQEVGQGHFDAGAVSKKWWSFGIGRHREAWNHPDSDTEGGGGDNSSEKKTKHPTTMPPFSGEPKFGAGHPQKLSSTVVPDLQHIHLATPLG